MLKYTFAYILYIMTTFASNITDIMKNWKMPQHLITGYHSVLTDDVDYQSFSNSRGSGIWLKALNSFIITSVGNKHYDYYHNNKKIIDILPMVDQYAASSIWGSLDLNDIPIKLQLIKNRDILTVSPLYKFMNSLFESIHVVEMPDGVVEIVIDDITDCIKFKFMFGEK